MRGLTDKRVSIDAILLYAGPKLPPEIMEQLRLAAANKLSIDELKFIRRLKSSDIPTISKVGNLLENKVVDITFLKSILLDDNKDISSKYLSTEQFYNNTSEIIKIANPTDVLEMIEKFTISNNFDTMASYIKRNSTKDTRIFLALCSRLKIDEAIYCLENSIPINVIYCYLYIKDGNKTWTDVVQFLESNESADRYIVTFCNGDFDRKRMDGVDKLLNLSSNNLIDELYFGYNIDIDILSNFTSYADRISSPAIYSGYAIKDDEKPIELCKAIFRLLSGGKDANYVAKFINSSCTNILLAIKIAEKHGVIPEWAIDAANELGPTYIWTNNNGRYQTLGIQA